MLAAWCFGSSGASAVEIASKAAKIKITGSVHTQFNTSSVDGELGSEFLIRRARLTAEVKINDFVSGKVQPDYGEGELSLKDAYMKLTYGPNLAFRIGQFKRPFDVFELTSSTEMLVVERALKIRGVSRLRSHSSLTEKLGFSDRDIGVEIAVADEDGRFSLTGAVTNGTGAGKVPGRTDGAIGEKQYTARLTVSPIDERDITLAVAGSLRPYEVRAATIAGDDNPAVEHAPAVQADLEIGNFEAGPHAQVGVVLGENWDARVADASSAPSFAAAQVIGAYKFRARPNLYVEAVEPLVRVGYADPNDDVADDGGYQITPGLQVFFSGRNKIALNVDIFLPEAVGEDTEYSIKAQSSMYF
ncbi:MAG: porin [Candidatus Eisenbacteria bacterium]